MMWVGVQNLFNGHGTASLVSQEMLERFEQIRTQAPFLFAHNVQLSAFQQQRKETLREIFCFFGTGALSPHETIECCHMCGKVLRVTLVLLAMNFVLPAPRSNAL